MQRGMDPRVRGPRVTKNGKVASLIKRVRITHEIPTFVGVDGKGFVLGVSPLQLASHCHFAGA